MISSSTRSAHASTSTKPYDGSQLLPLEKRLEEAYGSSSSSSSSSSGAGAKNCQDYFALDRPEQATWLTCLDASRIALVDNTGGLALFAHRLRPTVYVRIVGRVVGIEEKEKRIIWLVDDGSAVIAVHHYIQPDDDEEEEERESQEEAAAKGNMRASKGKERAVECGIPPEYIRPEAPPTKRAPRKPRDTRRALEDSMSRARNALACIEIGTLVRAIGRVRIGPQRERIVLVERVVVEGRQPRTTRPKYGRTQGTLQMLNDDNEEPRHLLQALYLSATEYSEKMSEQALRVESNQQEEEEAEAEGQRLPMGVSRIGNEAQERAATAAKKKQWVLPKEEVVAQHLASSSRRLGMSKTDNVAAASAPFKAPRPAESGRCTPQSSPEDTDTVSNGRHTPSSGQTTGTPRHRRKLRSFHKLPDAMLTDGLFRVYVQKHIVDFCNGDEHDDSDSAITKEVITISDDDDDDVVGLKTPRTSVLSSRRREAAAQQPPAFTMAYLSRVSDLRGFAFRLVRILLEKRERKERREARRRGVKTSATSSSSSKSRLHKRSYVSHEKERQKVEQLFAWVIRAMVADGVIVFAKRGSVIRAPLNGRRPRGRSTSSTSKLCYGEMTWSSDDGEESSDNSSNSSSGSPTPRKRRATPVTRSRAGKKSVKKTTALRAQVDVEAYQAVTPQLLARPLSDLIKLYSMTDAHVLTNLLCSADERWSRVSASSIEDALPLALDIQSERHHEP